MSVGRVETAGVQAMAIYRKGEGLSSRGGAAGILFFTALFGCRRLAGALDASFDWARRSLVPTPLGSLTGAWVVAGTFLAACAAGLWILMNHARAVDFLVDMEQELRKVSWPIDFTQARFADRYRELWQSSMIVIVSVVVMGVALFLYDIVLGNGVSLILGS